MSVAPRGQFRPTPHLRRERRPVVMRVTLVDMRGERLDAMVRDVGSRGVSAVVCGSLPGVDEVVQMLVPGQEPLWGLVRRVEGSTIGIEFDTGTPGSAGNDGAGVAVGRFLAG